MSTAATPIDIPAVKAPSNRGARRRSRECAVQGLYAWILNYEPDEQVVNSVSGASGASGVIEAHLRDSDEFAHCDLALFQSLIHGTISHAPELRAAFTTHIDRAVNLLSPVEHAILLLGTYELMYCPETPMSVVINEAIEVSKAFGGNDAYRYINGVLDKVAGVSRTVEFAAKKRGKTG